MHDAKLARHRVAALGKESSAPAVSHHHSYSCQAPLLACGHGMKGITQFIIITSTEVRVLNCHKRETNRAGSTENGLEAGKKRSMIKNKGKNRFHQDEPPLASPHSA